MRGNFGNTLGSRIYDSNNNILDAISTALTAASVIPGLDTFTNLASIPVDLARGDYISAGLSALGAVPVVGEIADTAKIAKKMDKAVDSAKILKTSKGKIISNPISKSIRTGKANKLDSYHAFPNVIDNYAGKAKKFDLKGADGKTRKLYQINGSLNGKDGIFEWILDGEKGVTTHRRFIENGKITGKPNSR